MDRVRVGAIRVWKPSRALPTQEERAEDLRMATSALLLAAHLDEIVVDLWPEHTVPTPADVVVAGVSLLELSRWCGSPCIHTAAAALPGTQGLASPSETRAVVVTTVVDVLCGQHVDVELDADLTSCGAVPEEARLIGRHSTAARVRVRTATGGELDLPSDVREGDLIAIPCDRPVSLRDVRIRQEDRVPSHCGR